MSQNFSFQDVQRICAEILPEVKWKHHISSYGGAYYEGKKEVTDTMEFLDKEVKKFSRIPCDYSGSKFNANPIVIAWMAMRAKLQQKDFIIADHEKTIKEKQNFIEKLHESLKEEQRRYEALIELTAGREPVKKGK